MTVARVRNWVTSRPVRAALFVSLSIFWLNFFLTTRWSAVDGSINGPKRPFFFAALALTSLLTVMPSTWTSRRWMSPRAARAIAVCGALFLTICFFVWFPWRLWNRIPFLDDFPLHYQEAIDFARLLSQGVFVGWEWRFLGGYHTSSDVSGGLGIVTALPMRWLGDAIGFHAAHLALFAALPLLMWRDLSLDERGDDRVTATAVGFVCVIAANYSYFLIRSGDTNSLAGVVCAFAAIVGAHAARRGRRWGGWLLTGALSLAACVHPGFFLYACGFLLLDAVLARSARSAVRALVAIGASLVVSLPLTWESWRYPSLFEWNNLVYTRPHAIAWSVLVKKLYYNVELLWLPGRWFNDYGSLALICAPIAAAVAWTDRSRARFHACALLVTLAVMRLNNEYVGYLFVRPIHMLVVFTAAMLAAVFVRHVERPALRWSLLAVIVLYVQVWFHAVPHVASLGEFNAELVHRVAHASGALVLVENNPHRTMTADPGGKTEPSRFGIHFEPLLAEETGRRLYAGGYSDGWQWNPWKGRLVAGGTFMGHALASTPHDRFAAELQHWGVEALFVWSAPTTRYLDQDSRFVRTWSDGVWTSYRFVDADPREVTTAEGSAQLANRTATGASVVLSNVRAGEAVVVRTNFHPAWTASWQDRPVPLIDRDGQLSFDAPCDGSCRVVLAYPKRRALLVIAVLALVLGGALVARIRERERVPR